MRGLGREGPERQRESADEGRRTRGKVARRTGTREHTPALLLYRLVRAESDKNCQTTTTTVESSYVKKLRLGACLPLFTHSLLFG